MTTKRTTGRRLGRLRESVFAMYGDECWLCGGSGADTIDHIIKLQHGGGDDLDNLRPAHGRRTRGCPGNFSGIRHRPQQPGTYAVTKSISHDDAITYGDGWISKMRGATKSTIFYRVAGMDLDHPFVKDWIAN